MTLEKWVDSSVIVQVTASTNGLILKDKFGYTKTVEGFAGLKLHSPDSAGNIVSISEKST